MGRPPFPARSDRPVAVEHVNVVPMDGRGVLPDHTVVIRDGTIAAVAPSSAIDATDMARVDGRGKYLMPGLADMHVHFYDVSTTASFLAHGVTSVRQMWGLPFHLAYRREVEAGRLPGPHLTTTTPIVDGEVAAGTGVPTHPGSICVTDGSRGARLIERLAARGYSQLKVYSMLEPAVFRRLSDVASSLGMTVVGHCPNALTFEEAMAGGQRCFEHLMSVWNGHLSGEPVPPGHPDWCGALADRLDLASIEVLAERMAADDVWNCPTTVVWQTNWRTIEDLTGDPDLRLVPPWQRHQWDPRNNPRMKRWVDAWDEALVGGRKFRRMMLDIVRVLHSAGAPLMVGSDCHNPFTVGGPSVHDELANFVEAGLSCEEALRCATAEPARFLGESNLWGTVAEGRRADLLLLDANPLENVAVAARPEAVFVNGYVFDRNALDELLRYRVAEVEHYEPSCPAEPEHASRRQLVESVSGFPVGHLCFAHRRNVDGTLTVEEEYETTHPRLLAGRRRSTLTLNERGEVERAEAVTDVEVGHHRVSIQLEGDRYMVRVEDVDGRERTSEVIAPLLPGPGLAPSVVGVVIAHAGEGTVDLLDVGDVAHASATEVRRTDTGWELKRVGEPSRADVVELDDEGVPVLVVTDGNVGARGLRRRFASE